MRRKQARKREDWEEKRQKCMWRWRWKKNRRERERQEKRKVRKENMRNGKESSRGRKARDSGFES